MMAMGAATREMPDRRAESVVNKSVLVVVAHPDDAEAFCGGTIARLTRAGNRVTLAICTNGDRGSHDTRLCPTALAQMRRDEQREAQSILGIDDVIWLGYRDGELSVAVDLKDRLIRVVRQVRPDIVITFDPWKHYEFHPDHRSVGFVAAEAYILADLPWICPEYTMEGIAPWHPGELYLFAPQEPNYWVDISDTIDIKIQGRLAHRSQNGAIQSGEDTRRLIGYFRQQAALAGAAAGLAFAESFRKVHDTDLYI